MRMAFVRRSRELAASGSRPLKEPLQSSCNQRDRERRLGTPDLFPRSNGGGSTIRHLSNGDMGGHFCGSLRARSASSSRLEIPSFP
jgi:hypothetical protein